MNDDLIMLSCADDDDDNTVFQTDEERKKLEKEIQEMDEDDSEVDITQRMISHSRSYWREVFG